MAAPMTASEYPASREEGFLHYMAREGRHILRWIIGASLVAIVICMVTIWFAAIIPAIILMAAYVLMVIAREVERRSDAEADAVFESAEVAHAGDVVEDHAEDDQLAPAQAELVYRESRTGFIIVLAVMAAAALIAFILFDLKVLAIGALVVFSYVMFIAAPLWLGWFNDDIEDETRRLEGFPQSARVKTE
jgi:1,4-dihydroxy-2-naphthoate octaprenyltransferase